MTIKYNLTKLYKSNAEIEVIASSLESFLAGERTTLDHIVTYQFQKQIVRAKPKKPNYKNYKPIDYHFSPNENIHVLPQ